MPLILLLIFFCKGEKHPLYACVRFKALTHDKMVSTLKSNNLCMNCQRPGHFVKQFKYTHRCRQCQKPHHTLLHFENEQSSPSSTSTSVQHITSNAAAGVTSNSLLLTCRVLIDTPHGSSIEAFQRNHLRTETGRFIVPLPKV